jgi:predicted ATP-binding protein involved in virulence
MQIKRILIEGFRGIERAALTFNTQTILLAGVNGSGKTSVLEALAGLMSLASQRLARALGQKVNTGLDAWSALDIHTSHDTMRLRAEADLPWPNGSARAVTWSLTLSREPQGRVRLTTDTRALDDAARDWWAASNSHPSGWPVITYYPAGRDIPGIRYARIFDAALNTQDPIQASVLAAHDHALTSRVDLGDFFHWIRDREDIENEHRIDDTSWRDPQLESARLAISGLIPGFERHSLRVRRDPPQLTLQKNQVTLDFLQLSNGEKGMIAMTCDVARRLAIANPSLKNPLHGEGLILIDEIELHLHPGWQRVIMRRLADIFPSCQFAVTTHSPAVLSEMSHKDIFLLLSEDGELRIAQPDAAYGMDAVSVMEELMGVSGRPSAVKAQLKALMQAITEGPPDLTHAKQLLSDLQALIGAQDHDLVRAAALIRRKELIGR